MVCSLSLKNLSKLDNWREKRWSSRPNKLTTAHICKSSTWEKIEQRPNTGLQKCVLSFRWLIYCLAYIKNVRGQERGKSRTSTSLKQRYHLDREQEGKAANIYHVLGLNMFISTVKFLMFTQHRLTQLISNGYFFFFFAQFLGSEAKTHLCTGRYTIKTAQYFRSCVSRVNLITFQGYILPTKPNSKAMSPRIWLVVTPQGHANSSKPAEQNNR